MTRSAIVIQNFNKPDTLDALGKSLVECDSAQEFDLIFWSDSPVGSRREVEYRNKCAEVTILLNEFFTRYSDRFRSITLRRNPVNCGTCKTCQISLDRVFQTHEFVIFSEDDTIFAPDALNWFIAMKNSAAFLDDAIWAIAGESIFFDGHEVVPDARIAESAKGYAIENELWEKYIPLSFIPSTCFATTRQKWAQFSETRGQPLGDVDVCHRCQAEAKKCLFPVVARVKDVGMLHPDGYSVSIHTKENVRGIKNCYLMSHEIRPSSGLMPKLVPFDGNAGFLFSRFTKLNGFNEIVEAERIVDAVPAPQPSNLVQDARKAGLDGDWDLALRLWRALKAEGLETPEVNTNIGLCLLKLGDRENARGTVQHVLTLHADDAYAQSIMAHILEADKDFTGAAKLWNELRQRSGLPEWLTASAVNGSVRCGAAGTALGSFSPANQ